MQTIIKTFKALLAICIVAASTGCRNDLSETEFFLPEVLEFSEITANISFIGWEIEIQRGCILEKQVLASDQKFFFIKSPEIAESPFYPISIQAYPIIKCGTYEGRFFLPCGGIFPYSTYLEWKKGFSSEILKLFYNATTQTEQNSLNYALHFNWQKLEQKLPENPWLLDKIEVLNGIICSEFTESAVKSKKINQIKLQNIEKILCRSDFILVDPYLPSFLEQKDYYEIRTDTFQTYICIDNESSFLCTAFLDSQKVLSLELNPFPL